MNIEDAIVILKMRMSILFSDEATWRSSGPPWSDNAESEERGYNLAIRELEKLIKP